MTSRLVEMQARFQQRQLQQREEKLVRLYESQQQKAFERVGHGSAGSNTSIGSNNNGVGGGGGKVRQMFDERRKAGIDRSYPLEPLKTKPSSTSNLNSARNGSNMNKTKSTTTVSKTQQKSIYSYQNKKDSKPQVRKEEINSVYINNNGNESYGSSRVSSSNGFSKYSKNSDRDLVDMMNNHNINNLSIEDEQMPPEVNDLEEVYLGKLSNVGGKLPSQKIAEEKKLNNTINKPVKKETKPIVKKTVRAALGGGGDVLSSPSDKTITEIMATKTSAAKAACPDKTRPSSKTAVKSPVCRDDLAECKYCHRRFATDRLQVHENICGKTGKKKRKTYDATKKRLEGTELEQYARKGIKMASTKTTKTAAKKDWRRTHEEFIAAIRAAKEAQAYVAKGGNLADLPPPPPSSNPDYVQCPHCGRKFNEQAAARHIPKCATYEFNKPKPGATKGKGKF